MIDRPEIAWWRSSVGQRSSLALAALAAMFALSLTRVVSAFEADAVAIAALTGLLFWTQLRSRRHARRLDETLDLLAIRLRYGPLTDEDLDTIRVLKTAGSARDGGARARRRRTGWMSLIRRFLRRPNGPGRIPPAA